MNSEFEQLAKASRRSSIVSIIGVILALSSLLFLFFKSQSLETSDKEFAHKVESQKNEIDFLKKEIQKQQEENTEPTQPQLVIERRPQVKTFSQRNNHCEKSRPFIKRVTATDGWKIDQSSITTNINSLSSQSTFIGVQNPSENWFELRAELRNNGDCIRLLSQTVAKDGRGFVNVTVKYEEYREVPAN